MASWTGDLGTESHFPLLQPFSLLQLFPFASDADESISGTGTGTSGSGLGGFHFMPESESLLAPTPTPLELSPQQAGGGIPRRREPYLVDVCGSIYIPGLLHIIHSAAEGLGDALLHWGAFIEQLRSALEEAMVAPATQSHML